MFKSEKAFTIIELIIVLAILTLMMGMVVINMTGVFNLYSLKTNSFQVLSLLRKVKQLAISKGHNFGLKLISSSEIALYEESDTEYFQVIKLDSGIIISHSRDSKKTEFYPLGNANAGTITLVNKQGNTYLIIISSTGRIRMIKG